MLAGAGGQRAGVSVTPSPTTGRGEVYVADAFSSRRSGNATRCRWTTRWSRFRWSRTTLPLIVRGRTAAHNSGHAADPPADAPARPRAEGWNANLKVPLPLAETSPYLPYGNVARLCPEADRGRRVGGGFGWPPRTEGLGGGTPAGGGADDLYTLQATNYLRDMQRITSTPPDQRAVDCWSGSRNSWGWRGWLSPLIGWVSLRFGRFPDWLVRGCIWQTIFSCAIHDFC